MDTSELAPFAVAVSVSSDAIGIALTGEFDISGARQFRSCVDELMASTNGAAFVVDLGDVTFIDSSAICALLDVRRFLAEEDRALRFERISDTAAGIFELTGLTDLFHDSASAAAGA